MSDLNKDVVSRTTRKRKRQIGTMGSEDVAGIITSVNKRRKFFTAGDDWPPTPSEPSLRSEVCVKLSQRIVKLQSMLTSMVASMERAVATGSR